MDPSIRIPLYCVAKGKTNQCESKYENNDKLCRMDHSASGWTTTEVMIDYIDWLYQEMDSEPFALVLDVYASHISEDVERHAAQLEIELIFVPANGTGTYQPLDRIIFGIVKKKLAKKELQNPVAIKCA